MKRHAIGQEFSEERRYRKAGGRGLLVGSKRGTYTAFVLIFIHLSNCKVYATPASYSSKGACGAQQGRNARMWLEDEGLEVRYLVHDGGT